jgi:GNAT superfamily N-acetyltransferase
MLLFLIWRSRARFDVAFKTYETDNYFMNFIFAAKKIDEIESLTSKTIYKDLIGPCMDKSYSIVYVVHEDEPIGFAGFTINEIHNKFLRPFIFVSAEYRRQGIGKALFENLKVNVKNREYVGWQFGCDSIDADINSFIVSLGFTKRLICHCIEFNFCDIASINNSFNNYPIYTLREIEQHKSRVHDFIVKQYIEEHFWSPSISPKNEAWNSFVLSDMDYDLSFVVMEDYDIKSCLICQKNLERHLIDICWIYSDIAQNDHLQLILLEALTKKAIDMNLNVATIELDTTKRNFKSLKTFLPDISDELWNVYQLI